MLVIISDKHLTSQLIFYSINAPLSKSDRFLASNRVFKLRT